MAVNYETQFATSAWPQIVATFGETVTYTQSGQAAANKSVLWRPSGTDTRYFADGEQEVGTGEVEGLTTDFSGYGVDDTFTIGGDTWAVESFDDRGVQIIFRVITRSQRYIGGFRGRIQR
jgi:hypothetical protein